MGDPLCVSVMRDLVSLLHPHLLHCSILPSLHFSLGLTFYSNMGRLLRLSRKQADFAEQLESAGSPREDMGKPTPETNLSSSVHGLFPLTRWQLGEASRHVWAAAGLASILGSLAACHHWSGARHQLHPGPGIVRQKSIHPPWTSGHTPFCPSRPPGGKYSRGTWAIQDPSGCDQAGEGYGGELASGAVSSGDFLKENYFDEYI